MPRLYQSIYLTIVGALIAVVLVAGALWRFGGVNSPANQGAEFAAEFAAAMLPDPDSPISEQRRAIEAFAARLHTDVTLFDAARQPIASVGDALRAPDERSPPMSMMGGRPGGPIWQLRLPDGRWLLARLPPRHGNPLLGLFIFLAAIAAVVAICAYPIVRGLTRRLERLRQGVAKLGAGDLNARVAVEGRDEVAQLARGFNDAAARIEGLVAAHRLLLANASHELRTPLARIKLGLELLLQTGDEKYRAALRQDIAELDELIDEILLTSRLDAARAPRDAETIDWLALAAEECARHHGVTPAGDSVDVSGDARLLRRALRNLLENAERHGAPPIEVTLQRVRDKAMLIVRDHGPGVPEAMRESVFAPFEQLARDSRGSGLGLAIVRKIARLHGGECFVRAAAGGGAEFVMELPARD